MVTTAEKRPTNRANTKLVLDSPTPRSPRRGAHQRRKSSVLHNFVFPPPIMFLLSYNQSSLDFSFVPSLTVRHLLVSLRCFVCPLPSIMVVQIFHFFSSKGLSSPVTCLGLQESGHPTSVTFSTVDLDGTPFPTDFFPLFSDKPCGSVAVSKCDLLILKSYLCRRTLDDLRRSMF